ncbi:MAG: serine--tRNA ligase [Bacteroidetes bacterium]|nr:serine--tRNA ligase [Bacteroidota bacterium]MCW5897624.1 serine--tRNA ligase [Bacteroidota bacterium]
MLDIKFVREHAEVVKEGVTRKREDPAKVDEALALDEKRRHTLAQAEQLKARKNSVSAEVAKKKSKGEDATAVFEEMRKVADEIKSLDHDLAAIEADLRNVLLAIPNIPHPSVPVGRTPEENQIVATWGEPPAIDFKPRPHWELVEKLGIIDFPRGVKITGAGFPVYVGKGAKLERALINFFLDEAEAAGYTEVMPPHVVNAASATGTGQLPDKEDQMYVATKDEFYLIPTAEVPVTNFYRDEILGEKQLPVKMCAYTPCFRREAGSYGKDVRGLNRVHQFDKVELVKFVHPSTSYDELESLRADAERLLQKLGLHYHVLLMCSGDLGFTQTKKYDLEVWSVGQQKWLEVSSCSNFESYQARRMNIRFKPGSGGKPEIVHTLNGSALALPRIVAAIIENYQTPEGKVIMPKVLHKYTGFEVIG